ncbi:MAG: DUF1501 domain-containing protein, partial [Pirellulales bacterium]
RLIGKHDRIRTAPGHKNAHARERPPIAALLADLKRHDVLKDTLVLWGGEMGRTPTVQLPVGPRPRPRSSSRRFHRVDGRRRCEGRLYARQHG